MAAEVIDTDPDVRRRQLDQLRAMTPTDRVALADRLSQDVTLLAIAGIRADHPDATPAQIRHELASRRFGRSLADAAYPHDAVE
jgi:hypothetical protein